MAMLEDPGELAAAAAIFSNPVGDGDFDRQSKPDLGEDQEDDPLLDVFDKSPLLSQTPVEALPTFYAALRLGPLTAIFCLAWGMLSPLWVELLKDRVCSEEFKYPANVCAHINEDQFKVQGDAVRSRTADYQLYDTLISCTPAVCFSVFVGAWSDRFGRKIPMVLPLIGMMLSVGYIAVVAHFPLRPAFLLVASVLASITGGWSIFLMAKFSYIGDHSTNKNRSMNIVIIDCFINLFANAGSYLGGFLNQQLGTVIPFYIIVGLYAISLVYVVLVIKDRERPKHASDSAGFSGLFTLNNIKDNVRMLRKTRLGDTRFHIWMVFMSLCAYNLVASGDNTIMQVFAEFNPIKWDLITYTRWSAITGFLTSSIAMGLMIVLRKYLHVHDTLIGCLALLSTLLAYFVYGIAWTGWMLYLGAFLGLFKVLMYVSVRSLMSTLVDPDEIGKSMSLISSMQSITPIFGAIIYTNLFARTSSFWPGLCFIAAAYTLVPVFAAMGYVDVARRRDVYKEDFKYRPISA